MELIEQLLRGRIRVEVEIRVGIPVSREELLQAERAGRMGRSHEHHVAATRGDQGDATQDERAHEHDTQLGVGLHERSQLIARQLDHDRRDARPHAHEAAPAGKRVQLAHEFPGPVNDDQFVTGGGGAHDLDGAFGDQEELGDLLALVDQQLAGRDGPGMSERRDSPRLRRRELRKHLAALFRREAGGCGTIVLHVSAP